MTPPRRHHRDEQRSTPALPRLPFTWRPWQYPVPPLSLETLEAIGVAVDALNEAADAIERLAPLSGAEAGWRPSIDDLRAEGLSLRLQGEEYGS